MGEALRIFVALMLAVGCLTTFAFLPAYFIRNRWGEAPGWVVVPGYFVALAVWMLCASFVDVI